MVPTHIDTKIIQQESTRLERALALQSMINAQAKDGYRFS